MNKSDSIAALAKALVAAQSKIENAHKTSNNPHFKSKYADLAEVINTARPVLTEHGLAVTQWPSYADGVVSVETMLTHESGEWISNVASAPADKLNAQGVGSAITYLRRYSLAAVSCIAQEDDDGNKASEKEAASQQTRAPTVHPETLLTWDDFLEDLPVTQLNSAQSRPLYKTLEMAMRMAQTDAELCQWAHDNADHILRLHDTARHYLREGFDKLRKELI